MCLVLIDNDSFMNRKDMIGCGGISVGVLRIKNLVIIYLEQNIYLSMIGISIPLHVSNNV